MKLHTVFITYNRLELTKQAIFSYLETVTVPHTWLVVDNDSTDGTQRWLISTFSRHHYLFMGENRYPGYACNRGFEKAPSDATLLHRADNDFVFLPGWCDEIERRFRNKSIGQLGLRTDQEEMHNTHNVGGNCVFRRDLWDKGLRWLETPWPQITVPGYTEDSFMSPEVRGMGYQWRRVRTPCIRPISVESAEDPYYRQTWADRGLTLS